MHTLKFDGIGETEVTAVINGLCRAGNCQLPLTDTDGRKQFAIDEFKEKLQRVIEDELVNAERVKLAKTFSEVENQIEQDVKESLRALGISGETDSEGSIP